MSALIKLGIAIAIGLFLWGAWMGFVHWVAEPRVAAQKAADQKEIDAVRAQLLTANVRADTNAGNYARCGDKLTTQSQQLYDANKRGNELAAANHSARIAAETADAGRRAAIAEKQKLAAAVPLKQACEAELKDTDAIGRAGAKARRGTK